VGLRRGGSVMLKFMDDPLLVVHIVSIFSSEILCLCVSRLYSDQGKVRKIYSIGKISKYCEKHQEISDSFFCGFVYVRQKSERTRLGLGLVWKGSCHKREKPQAPTPQAPIRNRQTRKVANAKGLNCNTNLTFPNRA